LNNQNNKFDRFDASPRFTVALREVNLHSELAAVNRSEIDDVFNKV